MKPLLKRLVSLLLAATLLLAVPTTAAAEDAPTSSAFVTNYPFVFVHGLSGWGSYDTRNKFIKYWGMRGGDLMKYLNKQGFDCYAASVDPTGSAWDRACELYAQLTGSVTDYGKEHSERCHHARYGKDFTGKPLISEWDSTHKINLLGHSFGGATIRMLSELMANGSEAEKAATDDGSLSPLFEGGRGDWIYSLTALAAPMNGTTAYDVDTASVTVGTGFKAKLINLLTKMMSGATKEDADGRADFDNANYDMLIDNAAAMNEVLLTQENLYYFSIPCNSSVQQADGTYAPDESKTELLFLKAGTLMGRHTATTPKGYTVDESWFMNDGLVNTISATAPFNAPQQAYDENNIPKGVWHILPVYDGDHTSLQGGIMKKNDVKAFYVEHLTRINTLPNA